MFNFLLSNEAWNASAINASNKSISALMQNATYAFRAGALVYRSYEETDDQEIVSLNPAPNTTWITFHIYSAAKKNSVLWEGPKIDEKEDGPII